MKDGRTDGVTGRVTTLPDDIYNALSAATVGIASMSGFGLTEKAQDALQRIEAVIASYGVMASQDVQAWQHEEDPARIISAIQKAQALRDGGASASSVKPYSVPLTRGVPPTEGTSNGL